MIDQLIITFHKSDKKTEVRDDDELPHSTNQTPLVYLQFSFPEHRDDHEMLSTFELHDMAPKPYIYPTLQKEVAFHTLMLALC